MIKKVMSFVILATCFLFTGCAGNQTAGETAANISVEEDGVYSKIPDVDVALEQSELVIQRFRAQRWESLRELCGKKMKGYFTDDVLREVWKDAISPSGAFENVLYHLPSIKDGHLCVQSVVVFKNRLVQFTLSWNKKNKLDGFFYVPLNKDLLESAQGEHLGDVLKIAKAFRQKDWQTFKSMRMGTTPDEQLEQWSEQVSPIGRFITVDNIVLGEKENWYVYSATHENGTLKLDIEFVPDGKFKAFYYNFHVNKVQNNTIETAKKESAFPAESTDKWFEREIAVSADPKYINEGLLTVPKNVEKPPVVILVHGSGCNDMNETLAPNHPFKDVAHDLADNGIAVLRYNKRCFAHSEKIGVDLTGDLKEHVLDDVSAAIKLMQHTDGVDNQRIYVLGHSLGASLIPYIATKHPELSGVISMAGALRGLNKVLYKQMSVIYTEIFEGETQAQKLSELEEDNKKLDIIDEQMPDDEVYMGLPGKFWKSMNQYVGSKYIDDVKIPVLVLQGDKDVQVYPELEYAGWLEAAQKHDNIQCHLISNASHLFLPVKVTGDKRQKYVDEYAVASHVVPEVIDLITNFVKASK